MKRQDSEAAITPAYARLRKRGLTLPQQNAIDLLVLGKSDTETAELLGVHRVTVTKWRCYDPVFQAALNARRAEVWQGGIDCLRAGVARAIDTLSEELNNLDSPNRIKAAVELVRLLRLPDAVLLPIGPTDPLEVVRGAVSIKRSKAHDHLDALVDDAKGLPPFESQVEEALHEIEERLADVGDDPANARCSSAPP